jgi:hypothetical protein
VRAALLAAVVALLAACGDGAPGRSPVQAELDRLYGPVSPALCRELNDLRFGDVPGEWTAQQRKLISNVASNRYEADCARS